MLPVGYSEHMILRYAVLRMDVSSDGMTFTRQMDMRFYDLECVRGSAAGQADVL